MALRRRTYESKRMVLTRTNNIWFTSDTHFGHVNIVRYCGRPFKTIEEHDRCIIDNWNALVHPGDLVYHLGDFGMPQGFADKSGYLTSIKSELKGQVHFIRGNHDKLIKGDLGKMFVTDKMYNSVKVVDDELDIKQNIILCHYPFQTWNRSHHGAWHLHGHCHGNLPTPDSMFRLDVGVDVHDFTPVSYDQVKAIMAKKVFKPVDHHGRK